MPMILIDFGILLPRGIMNSMSREIVGIYKHENVHKYKQVYFVKFRIHV